MKIDYDDLLEQYNKGLHDKLRNFSTGHDFLETWVPDEDPNRSLAGIFEAADVSGLKGSLEVNLDSKTAHRLDPSWLKQQTKSYGDLVVDTVADKTRIKFQFIDRKGDLAEVDVSTAQADSKSRIAYRGKETLRPLNKSIQNRALSLEDVHASYRTKLSEVSTFPREGKLTGDGTLSFETLNFGLSVRLNKKQVIKEAFHSGAQGTFRALLECFCEGLPGLSLQEAAEHSVLRLENYLRDPALPPPVTGIITPENADPMFQVPQKLIRGLYQESVSAGTTTPKKNFWTPKLPASWLKLSETDKTNELQAAISSLCPDLPGLANGLALVSIQNEVRLIVHPHKPSPFLGEALLTVERALQARYGIEFEVLLDERSDTNKPREKNIAPKA